MGKKKKAQERIDDAYYREDTWANAVTGENTANIDARTAATITRRADLTEEELEHLYDYDDLVGLVCDLPPREMVREWIDLVVPDDTAERGAAVMLRLEELGAKQAFRDALTWSRLFGGGLVVLGVNDGALSMAEPLSEERIKAVRWLKVLHRFDVEVEKRGDDGEVELWRVRSSGEDKSIDNKVIHASRVIAFDGLNVTRKRRIERKGWGLSVIDRMLAVIRDFQSSYASVFASMNRMGESALRIEGLAKMLASEGGQTASIVLQRIARLSYYRSTYRFLPIDMREEVSDIAPSFGGVNDVIDRLWMRLSSATRMPVTLLAGRSPSGLNATGESDMAQWYDNIKAEQEDRLKQPLERLIRLLLLENGQKEPESWTFNFRPLKQLTEHETAEQRKKVAETDALYVNSGIVSVEEVRESRWTSEGYSMDMSLAKEAPPARPEADDDESE